MSNEEWLIFWKQVQSDFLKNNRALYLCDASNTFDEAWQTPDKTVIVDLAKIFMQENKKQWYSNKHILFTPEDFYIPFPGEYREIRIEFLNWIIERLEKETLI